MNTTVVDTLVHLVLMFKNCCIHYIFIWNEGGPNQFPEPNSENYTPILEHNCWFLLHHYCVNAVWLRWLTWFEWVYCPFILFCVYHFRCLLLWEYLMDAWISTSSHWCLILAFDFFLFFMRFVFFLSCMPYLHSTRFQKTLLQLFPLKNKLLRHVLSKNQIS